MYDKMRPDDTRGSERAVHSRPASPVQDATVIGIAALQRLVGNREVTAFLRSSDRSAMRLSPSVGNPQLVQRTKTVPADIEVNLAVHEQPLGGHTIARHIGKSHRQLAQRLINDPNVPLSSSFETLDDAKASVEGVVTGNAQNIRDWAQGNPADNQAFYGGNVAGGVGIERAQWNRWVGAHRGARPAARKMAALVSLDNGTARKGRVPNPVEDIDSATVVLNRSIHTNVERLPARIVTAYPD